MHFRRQFLVLIPCIAALFCSCKKEVEVEFYFGGLQVVQSLQNGKATIAVGCDVLVLADDYEIDEFGIIWGTSSDLVNTGTYTNFGREEEFDETVDVDYGFVYYFQPYALINGKEYLGEVKSIDAGPVPASWNTLPAQPAQVCTEIAVSPAGIIHVFGIDGRQYYSSNEGSTWTQVNHINTNYLSEPEFIDENVMYVWADDAIRKSTNGGLSWTQIASPSTLSIGAVDFYDATTIFCAIADTIYRSVNSGATWTGAEIPTLETNAIISDVHFMNSSVGYAITYDGEVARTTDGGANWTLQTTGVINPGDQGRHIYTVTETRVMAGTSYQLYYSDNSGVTWESKYSWMSTPLAEIDFCDASNGVAVFGNAKAIRTTNGGSIWEDDEFPGSLSTDLTDVEVLSPSKAYAMKYTGVVYIYQ
jgi:photosystem II stability/assembly factor-like uncharacterized protein